MASYELVGLNTAVPQLQGIPSSDTGVVPGSLSVENGIFYTLNATGAAQTTIEVKLDNLPSVSDFSTVALADSNGGGNLFVPSGVHSSTIATPISLTSNYQGYGQIQTADGNRTAKFYSHISAAPSSLGNHNSIDTAFNGDLSHSIFQEEHFITGASTLGQPASGYLYTPEAYPHYHYLYNSSGWNQSTSGNDGRTAAAAYRTQLYQTGQGDCVAYNVSAFVTGTKAGSTSFLANPAASMMNGDMTAGADGVYLNPRELVLDDNGYDVAGIADVVRLKRTNNTGAKSVWWCAYRVQSEGTKEVDVAYSAIGKVNIGQDFSFLTLPTSGTYNRAAITLSADQRVYGNATPTDSSGLQRFPSSTGTDYFSYRSSLTAWEFVVGNASALQIYNNQVVVPNGEMAISTAGKGLRVKEGSNAKQGTAVLVAGSATVSNTAVTANSRIFLTSQLDGGTPGFVRVSSRIAGTSFTITSSNALDTSTIAYEIFEPA